MGQINWKELLRKYKTYVAAAAILLILLLVLALRGCGSTAGESEENKEETPETENVAPEEEVKPAPQLEENTHASIERLMERYCDAIVHGDLETYEMIVKDLSETEKEQIVARSAFYDSFENIECHIMDGPKEDSYIVFLSYDAKLKGIDTPAPDIRIMYVTPKDEDGERYIDGDASDNEELQAYVAELEKNSDVQALEADVTARYQAALEQDSRLSEWIARIYGQEPEEEEPEAPEEPSEEEEPEADEGEPQEEPEAGTAQNRETRTNDTVNIRKEPSTEAERLAVAYKGDAITQIESYDDGWSKVEFKGVSGYVKTEFLE